MKKNAKKEIVKKKITKKGVKKAAAPTKKMRPAKAPLKSTPPPSKKTPTKPVAKAAPIPAREKAPRELKNTRAKTPSEVVRSVAPSQAHGSLEPTRAAATITTPSIGTTADGAPPRAEEALPPPVVPHRVPVRKVIRDGKVVPFERRDEGTSLLLRTELVGAWGRLRAAATEPALAPRSLAEFWEPSADVTIPSPLDRPCGELAALDLATVEAATRGSESALRHLIEACHRAASAAIEAPPEADQRKALRAAVTLDPAWRAGQPHYPAQTRAFIGLVEWQCKLAAAWPFAFARFMATIPQRLSSDQFVALAAAVDGALSDVAHAVGRDEATTIALIEAGRARLVEIFEADCPEIHRQWNIVLRGSGVAIDALIQRYVIDSLNREWQMLLGAMIIGALRGAERADTVSAVHHHTP